MSDNPSPTLANLIADRLGETEAEPRAQLERVVDICGAEFAQAVLDETLALEAGAGLAVADGRRRTPGGVFFYLVRQRIDRADWKRILQQAAQALQPPVIPLLWAERASLVEAAAAQPGSADAIKLTVVGRPRDIKRHDTFVITIIEDTQPVPALPSGVPVMESLPTTYKVFIPAKRWRTLESALRNPQDVLVVEGYAYPHDKAQTVLVLAVLATTTGLQTSYRNHQKVKARR